MSKENEVEREIRLKRLHFRSAHRGSKETDLILGSYVAERLHEFSDAELSELEGLLDENDTDIWDWVSGKSQPTDNRYALLIATLRKRYELHH